MIYNKFYQKISFLKKQPEITKVMLLYRYVSLVITSLFFFLGDTSQSIEKKIFIILCIVISALILNHLYIKNRDCTTKIKLLVFIETIGNIFILIPSGGLTSPYVWYSLNTILISSIELNRKYVWINIFIYLIASTRVSYLIFNIKELSFLNLLKEKSDLILSFILITVAMEVLAEYARKIQNERRKLITTNADLLTANEKIRESMTYIVELYGAVDLFTTIKNKGDLIELIKEYTQKITKTKRAVFYALSDYQNNVLSEPPKNYSPEERFKQEVFKMWDKIINIEEPLEVKIDLESFIFFPLKSKYMTYGILGIGIVSDKKQSISQENIEQLKFLARLSSMVLERFELEQVNERLLVSEEQNRIANEIHDSALQRIFSTSCGIFSLIKNLKKLNTDEIEEELNFIRNSLNNTMQELRAVIYGLSWRKGGTNNFENYIRNYLEEIKKLNNIKINFNLIGNDELLSSLQKKALYRVICEGISNAIHHGRAKKIDVSLGIESGMALLQVIDNGTGFEINELNYKKDKGIGLKNIKYLVSSLNGEVDLQSKLGEGTRLIITFPNSSNFIKEEVI